MIISVDPVVNVYVPNAMSGGGDNGLFDISYGAAVRRITLLRIYDRWGNMIHEVRNGLPGDRDAVWDGTFRGRAVNPGVYLWSLELELFDGRVWREMGDVTVVR
jgi:gliding motility-associated-like protein